MKKSFLALGIVLLGTNLFAQSFVSPIGFISNETNKTKVITFIEKQVKDDYNINLNLELSSSNI